MKSAQIIVWERTGVWAGHLRRLAARVADDLRECRTKKSCEEMLERWPASLLAVEVAADELADQLNWLSGLGSRRPRVKIVALVDDNLASAELVLRECGAVHVAYGPRHLRLVAKLVENHLAQAPQKEMEIDQRIFAELPWSTASQRWTT